MPAAGLDQAGETGQVGIDIGARILERVAHARLRGEMHDRSEASVPEKTRQAFGIDEIVLGETEIRMLGEAAQAGALERHHSAALHTLPEAST